MAVQSLKKQPHSKAKKSRHWPPSYKVKPEPKLRRHTDLASDKAYKIFEMTPPEGLIVLKKS